MEGKIERRLPSDGNARQATSVGKSGTVETGLTRPATTALLCPDYFSLSRKIDW